MRVTAEFINTDNVDVTLTITMPLGHWKKLRDQLSGDGWPGSDLHSAIGESVRTLEKQVYTKRDKSGEE